MEERKKHLSKGIRSPHPPEPLQLKQQVQDYLNRHGITAAELSRRSGVPKQVLSLWLAGVEPRKLSYLKKLATALGLSIDELCFKTINSNPDWIVGTFEGRILQRKLPK